MHVPPATSIPRPAPTTAPTTTATAAWCPRTRFITDYMSCISIIINFQSIDDCPNYHRYRSVVSADQVYMKDRTNIKYAIMQSYNFEKIEFKSVAGAWFSTATEAWHTRAGFVYNIIQLDIYSISKYTLVQFNIFRHFVGARGLGVNVQSCIFIYGYL